MENPIDEFVKKLYEDKYYYENNNIYIITFIVFFRNIYFRKIFTPKYPSIHHFYDCYKNYETFNSLINQSENCFQEIIEWNPLDSISNMKNIFFEELKCDIKNSDIKSNDMIKYFFDNVYKPLIKLSLSSKEELEKYILEKYTEDKQNLENKEIFYPDIVDNKNIQYLCEYANLINLIKLFELKKNKSFGFIGTITTKIFNGSHTFFSTGSGQKDDVTLKEIIIRIELHIPKLSRNCRKSIGINRDYIYVPLPKKRKNHIGTYMKKYKKNTIQYDIDEISVMTDDDELIENLILNEKNIDTDYELNLDNIIDLLYEDNIIDVNNINI